MRDLPTDPIDEKEMRLQRNAARERNKSRMAAWRTFNWRENADWSPATGCRQNNGVCIDEQTGNPGWCERNGCMIHAYPVKTHRS